MEQQEFNIFYNFQGITVHWNAISSEKNFEGFLLMYLADTPAAGVASGFKEGVGGAYRCCRTCMITKEELCQKVSLNYL